MENVMPHDLPLSLKIPTPVHNVLPRGRNSQTSLAKVAKCRVTDYDYARIEACASVLDVSVGEFMRQVILSTVLELQGNIGEVEWATQLSTHLNKNAASKKDAT